MAALTDLNAYLAKLSIPRELVPTIKVATTTVVGRSYDLFTTATLTGTAPTAAVVPTKATVGGFLQQDAGTEELFNLGGNLSSSQAGLFILCDRLSHQGALDGTVATANLTTNLPTAALTRYTTGTGVMLGVSIYTQIGATATTLACNYTNDAGGSSNTPLTVFGGTGYREVNRFVLMPLATGDTGIRAVNNSTLTVTTGTAGAFGYTLYKPLMAFHIDRAGGQVDFSLFGGGMSGGLPVIQDDACLFWMSIPAGTSTSLLSSLSLTTV